jgi:hypothetical protein
VALHIKESSETLQNRFHMIQQPVQVPYALYSDYKNVACQLWNQIKIIKLDCHVAEMTSLCSAHCSMQL